MKKNFHYRYEKNLNNKKKIYTEKIKKKHGELIENKPTFIQQTRKHKQHKHLECFCFNNAVLCA
jgi:hypothetical protein